MSQLKSRARTYNHVQVPRPYMPGKPRFSSTGRGVTMGIQPRRHRDGQSLLYNHRSPPRCLAKYETPEFSEKMFLQGIAGTLELFHLSLLRFQQLVGEVTSQPVAVYQRIDQAGQKLPIGWL